MVRTVLVRGVGDVGSAVAYVLADAGFAVLIHDDPAPTYTRRGMAFVDAVFEGPTRLAQRIGKRAAARQAIPHMLACRRAIPVSVDGFVAVLDTIHPDVLVDARMRKHSIPARQIGLAPLTIGLGPCFTAGETVHLAVETAWGDQLGRVVKQGRTLEQQGEPRPLGGYGRERFVYGRHGGVFRTARSIGEKVEAGEPIGVLERETLCAPLAGCIRGLTHDGVLVEANTKVIEIDPRGDAAAAFGLGERPRLIAEGVLRAIRDQEREGQL
jgi:xanthine dehydrogenase accessory factor